MISPCQKPPATRRRKKPGHKAGHPGNHRPPPERIGQRQEHRLPRCPHCGGRLRRCTGVRTRYIEDIPRGIAPVVTGHTIHRNWCPHRRKRVEPVVPDALPGAALGNRTLALSAWLHYGLGNTLSQILEVFNIDRSRGEPALRRFFIAEFRGTPATDFWGAYNAVVCAARQGCLVHLLRGLETVERYGRGGKEDGHG